MTQRVVLRMTRYSMNVRSLRAFVNSLELYGAGPLTKVEFVLDDNGVPCLIAELPESAAEALAKAAAGPRPTKAQEAVRERLQARAEAVRSGARVPGYLPPVAKGGRVLKTRKRTA